ncbi:hypothetical protein CSKR_107318 [Clonorchis sinensis]|uniref:Uncharacterized protein n=1 Tax=Clonorchis sinensis TaxID=79923 RepID=A0A3R7F427_CLOSI|nr:hypothetical protein CSKR_107318 [Clonorchis sinensis]
MPPERSTRAALLPGCPGLYRGNREIEVGFEPWTFQFHIEILQHSPKVPEGMDRKFYLDMRGLVICSVYANIIPPSLSYDSYTQVGDGCYQRNEVIYLRTPTEQLQTIEQGSKTLICISFTKLNTPLLLERVFLNFLRIFIDCYSTASKCYKETPQIP